MKAGMITNENLVVAIQKEKKTFLGHLFDYPHYFK